MIRFLIYFCPIIVNMINGGLFFFSADTMSRAGKSGLWVGGTIAIWSLVYSVVSWITGKFVTERNSAPLISVGAVLLAITSLCFLCFESLALYFTWMTLCGIGCAIYCCSFQVFMKAVEPDQTKGIIRSAALYTCSWSTGFATGALVFGGMTKMTALRLTMTLSILMAAGIMVIYWVLRDKIGKKTAVPEATASAATMASATPAASGTAEPEAELSYDKCPNLAWLGWLCGGIGTFVIMIIRSMEPFRGAELGFSKEITGFALATLSYIQALVALCLSASKSWMYKPGPILGFGVCGILGMLCFGLGSALNWFFIGAVLYGIFSGSMYVYFVFYSLVHPTKSGKYVAVNECVVGLVGILGPMMGGMFSSLGSATPFLIGGGILLCSILFHFFVLFRKKAWTFIRMKE